ncbi:hypothetical protein ABT336_12100 [Micromonospora sp. NPDC000207]|uniref:hypothetical protein n=1 Tax=Micromonospora sp. NPDC000207 TaxID=3154246 RepID=UPI00332C18DE
MNPRARRNLACAVGQAATPNAISTAQRNGSYPANLPMNSRYEPQQPATRAGVR